MNNLVLKVLGFFFKSVKNVYIELGERQKVIDELTRENKKLENLTRRLERRVSEQQVKIDEWRYKYFNKQVVIDNYRINGDGDGNGKEDYDFVNVVNGTFN